MCAFLPALFNGFVDWDDEQTLTGNLSYRGLGLRQLAWMWTTFHTGHFQPLTWMSWGFDYLVWGMNPVGYHLGNIVLHAANAVLVALIAAQVFAREDSETSSQSTRRMMAAFAGLLFAIHPLRVESVSWATERRDVLSGFFFLLALLLYLRRGTLPEDASFSRRFRAISGAVVLFVCALLSKAIAVTLPAVLLILDVYPLRRLGGARGWRSAAAKGVYIEKLPFVVFAVGSSLLAPHALGHVPQLDIPGKIAVSSYSFAFYLWKSVLPQSLSPLYEMPASVHPLELRYLAGYAAVVGAMFAAWSARHRFPAVTACIAAYTVTALPVLGVVQNGPQIAADRYTYLPGAALALLGAAGLDLLARRIAPRAALAAGSALVIVLAVLTWRQSHVWHDTSTLWAHALAVDSRSSVAHHNAGLDLFRRGRVDDAIREFRRAVELKPGNAPTHVNLGVALARQGKTDSAVAHYEIAYGLDPATDDALVNWGVALQGQGRVNDAIELFQRAAAAARQGRATSRALNDAEASAHANWGLALAESGRDEEAIEHFLEALQLDPLNTKVDNNLGVVLARLGRLDEAARHYRRALDLDSSNVEARVNLGNVFVRAGRFSDAIIEYRRAATAGVASADVSYNWGVALANLEQFDEARGKFEEALGYDPTHVAAREALSRVRAMTKNR